MVDSHTPMKTKDVAHATAFFCSYLIQVVLHPHGRQPHADERDAQPDDCVPTPDVAHDHDAADDADDRGKTADDVVGKRRIHIGEQSVETEVGRKGTEHAEEQQIEQKLDAGKRNDERIQAVTLAKGDDVEQNRSFKGHDRRYRNRIEIRRGFFAGKTVHAGGDNAEGHTDHTGAGSACREHR